MHKLTFFYEHNTTLFEIFEVIKTTLLRLSGGFKAAHSGIGLEALEKVQTLMAVQAVEVEEALMAMESLPNCRG